MQIVMETNKMMETHKIVKQNCIITYWKEILLNKSSF